jgi:hypothetical protein
MKKIFQTFIAVTLVSISAASAQSNVFKTIDSAEINLGYLSVFELPSNGGAFVSGSGSPVAQLNAVYPTSDSVVFSPNTITNTGTNWYNPGTGGVGSLGQKQMSAFLYAQETGIYGGQILQFEGIVSSFNLTTNAAGLPYTFSAFIKDFAPDYSSVVETIFPITSTGNFNISQALDPAAGRHVQWGLQMIGPNIWPGDTEQLEVAGSVTVEAIPEPSTYALLGLAVAGGLLARRLRRKA